MILLDESVRFFMYMEHYQFSRKLTPVTSSFALQMSRLRSDILSVRELVVLGQEGTAHVIGRSFVDGIELAMALAEDPDFALAYTESVKDDDFWAKMIGYGRIYVRVERFLRASGVEESEVVNYISRHKSMKNALSDHVHIINYSAFRAAVSPSITRPGMVQIGHVGSISAQLPQLCLALAVESHVFAACCVNSFARAEPTPAFANYKLTAKLQDVITSTHVLQELLVRYGDSLREWSSDFFDEHWLKDDSINL